ncbi:Uncharacterised protein [Chryseobacterium nakagawai]|uniref:Superinfection immunity protein n=1 Tax=Chryseobacterium nakagawai TaxID=1241982 RepID=A0AAD0YRG5_CHRNA|nr:superinfection immunity protein [Chryseobacterium nakagawai]AZA91771.1 superinfection immunity protein [Chryseobacterium nakagawai]VEH18280.1 Uncharacterised protein [Chryseobacterium nakagawai]
MLVLLSTISHNNDGFPFFKMVLFIYFIPTIVALFRLTIIRFKFFSVLFINLFFGWTIYGWWFAFTKAFSSKNIVYIKNKSKDIAITDKYDQLIKLNNLLSSGAINEFEYEAEKKKILNH